MKCSLVCLALVSLVVAGSRAEAQTALSDNARLIGGCLNAAAAAYQVPPVVLVVLLNVEGGSLGHVSPNSNATVDIGPMQVNQIWIPQVAAHWQCNGPCHVSSPCATTSAPTLKRAPGFCARASMRRTGISGGAWAIIIHTTPRTKRSSNT